MNTFLSFICVYLKIQEEEYNTNLKQNENIVVKGYKWVGKIRQERDGGGVGILIKDT